MATLTDNNVYSNIKHQKSKVKHKTRECTNTNIRHMYKHKHHAVMFKKPIEAKFVKFTLFMNNLKVAQQRNTYARVHTTVTLIV